ncbi:serine hydrolase domain-containing protein [Saccharicrinis aurantiacus]|uniref:serine hydrolase domain-containing protein n=1 Tax=Saccharicrinis aurantiacus TaxID=1849719 RepID=UPI002490FB9B|nr:serine hydrolase domain-containing protein [Saccharicrinis aurantiacus]
MTFLRKIFISLIVITLITTLNVILFSWNNAFDIDFIPPTVQNSSNHINNTLSERPEFRHIDKNVERFIKRNNLAGASLAITKNGALKFAKGYGSADKELDIAVQPYNIFRIASVSKLVTATAIMKLCETNKISLSSTAFGSNGILNDSIYLNYRDKKVEQITVRDLLNHTSGWTNRWGDPMFIHRAVANQPEFSYPITGEDIIRFMLKKRLHYPPGTLSSYSNFGYAILEKIIEKASGTSYENYVKTEILYPLEIFDMKIGGSYLWERYDLEVKYYEPDEPYLVPDHLERDKQALRSYGGNDIRTLGAAGGWIASSTDILKLVSAIDGFEHPDDILSFESIRQMTEIENLGDSPLGWRGIRKAYWYRTGTLAGSSALIVRYDNGISFAIIFNSSSWKGPEFANDIKKMMDKSLKSVKTWPEYDLYNLKLNTNNTEDIIF